MAIEAARENRAAMVRRMAGMPVGAGSRSEEKGTEAAMRPRPSAPRGERENAAMTSNQIEESILALIELWAAVPSRTAHEAGVLIQLMLARMLSASRA